MSKSWIRKAQESDSWYQIPIGREYTSSYGLWTGMERYERIFWSPVYLIIVLGIWFKGCFLGQDYIFLKTYESEGDAP